MKQAEEVKEDIESIRAECIENSKKRIERIVQDLRVAMDCKITEILKEANNKVRVVLYFVKSKLR